MSIDVKALADQVLSSERRALSRAITLTESTHPQHRQQAEELLQILAPHSGKAIRIGISGVPGAGKSTLIETLGLHLIKKNKSIAVLAVDPSSALSGGSIMADKTRMEQLSKNAQVFIRPSPSACTLGGVTRRTRESILLCEAAGFDIILVETVGVGQSETAVADMTDMFLLLLLPIAGDEIQGIKRGIMELADVLIINKADGELVNAANHCAADYMSALSLLRPRTKDWQVPVKTCSALYDKGISEVWDLIKTYHQQLIDSKQLSMRRANQAKAWLWSEISENLISSLINHPKLQENIKRLETAVVNNSLPPTIAAAQIINLFYHLQAENHDKKT